MTAGPGAALAGIGGEVLGQGRGDADRVRATELRDGLLEEGRLLRRRLDEEAVGRRERDGEGDPGEAGPRPEVEEASETPDAEEGDGAQAVEEVVPGKGRGISGRCQVEALRPGEDDGGEAVDGVPRRRGEVEVEGRQAGRESGLVRGAGEGLSRGDGARPGPFGRGS